MIPNSKHNRTPTKCNITFSRLPRKCNITISLEIPKNVRLTFLGLMSKM